MKTNACQDLHTITDFTFRQMHKLLIEVYYKNYYCYPFLCNRDHALEQLPENIKEFDYCVLCHIKFSQDAYIIGKHVTDFMYTTQITHRNLYNVLLKINNENN